MTERADNFNDPAEEEPLNIEFAELLEDRVDSMAEQRLLHDSTERRIALGIQMQRAGFAIPEAEMLHILGETEEPDYHPSDNTIESQGTTSTEESLRENP